MIISHYEFCLIIIYYSGRRDVQGENAVGSLGCFNRMLRPSIYFTDETVPKVGASTQICSRVRYALAHVNSNLKTIHSVRIFIYLR